MAESTGTGINNLFTGLLTEAVKFTTPFVQKVMGTSSTPKEVQAESLKIAALNGSGPNNPTLAQQAPLSLLDFITGRNVSNIGASTAPKQQVNTTLIIVVALVIAGVYIFVKK